MCISPITLKNPYYGLGEDVTYSSKFGDSVKVRLSSSLNWLHNTLDTHIQVPCGNCAQCVSMRQSWVTQRVQMESLRSHLFFFTLTYKNEFLPKTNISDYHIPYPNYKHVQDMFKRLRNKGLKFRYWVVSEYGKQKHRPHYHGILAVPIKDKNNKFEFRSVEQTWSNYLFHEWRVNVGTDFEPVYKSLFDYHCKYIGGVLNRNFDFHYIEPVKDHDNDVSFYVSKYILKYDDRINKLIMKINLDQSLSSDESSELIKLIKPRSVMSKDFGSYKVPEVKKYIEECISRSDLLPQYYDLYTGKSCLLSPYYRKHLLSNQWLVNKFMLYSQSDKSLLLLDDRDSVDYNNDSEIAFRLKKKHMKNLDILGKKY